MIGVEIIIGGLMVFLAVYYVIVVIALVVEKLYDSFL